MAPKNLPKQDTNSLDLSDLNGSVKNALVFNDSHFGLDSGIWTNAQRIADMLPIDVQVSGDLLEDAVLLALEKAKGAELQQKIGASTKG